LHYFDRHPKYPSSTTLYDDSIFKRLQNRDWRFRFRIFFLRTLRQESFSSVKWKLNYFFKQANDERYLSFFENLEGLKGEVTPSYSILEKEDIQEMYRLAPDTKLILLLRNPIYRAWSQYLHQRRKIKGYETMEIDIEAAIRFMKSKDQVLRSDYESMIANYLSVYPKAQLFIGFFDDIAKQPDKLMHSIIDFIGGNTEYISEYLDLKQKFNVNKKIEMPKEVFEFLKAKYREPIERLALKFGGYFNVWLAELYEVKGADEQIISARMKI